MVEACIIFASSQVYLMNIYGFLDFSVELMNLLNCVSGLCDAKPGICERPLSTSMSKIRRPTFRRARAVQTCIWPYVAILVEWRHGFINQTCHQNIATLEMVL